MTSSHDTADAQEWPLVGDRYRLAERIGRGGMATVYRARDEQLDRPVAVKVMRADLGEDARFVRRFEAEARRAASVSHPNVVPVYDVGTDGAPYMVMELVEGGDVATLLSRDGRQTPERAAQLTADAAAALQAAHDAGLVHRDVKPGNILLGADGRAMVADFGIARATGEDTMTRTGTMLGSVEYFSPEQARGERASAASDIYSLGAVLYELLTGRRPFSGDSPYAVATARLLVPPPDPLKVVPELPPNLAEIATRAMALEPAQRFTSADAMRQSLLEWLASTDDERSTAPIAAVPASSRPSDAVVGSVTPIPSRVGPPAESGGSRRRSVGIWPVALLLLTVGVGGYLGARLLMGGPGPQATPPVVVGSPGGGVAADPTSSESPPPSQSASASPPSTAEPTESPATPDPTTASATSTPAPVPAAGPSDTVGAFYGNAENGRFDDAYALWSDRMKDVYDRAENLDERFADTTDITFDALYVAEQSASSATVQANFTERYDSGSSRRFVGYWRLVRVNGRWLLDEPTY